MPDEDLTQGVSNDAQLERASPILDQEYRPRVYMLDGRVFVTDPESAAALLRRHRIWTMPVGVRPARNESCLFNFPCMLSPEQTTLVLREDLADLDHGRLLGGRQQPMESGLGAPLHAEQGLDEGSPAVGRPRWRYPETASETNSMTVFEDLWRKGFYVAGGSNYGADYVIYEGPPTECHSAAAVLITRSEDDGISPAEISAFARAQQAVGKRALLATSSPMAGGSPAAAALDQSGAGAPSERGRDEGVRYLTLQFHSVNSRDV